MGVHAVDGASITVTEGSITGLIGPNGSGKSTIIDCVSGFQRRDSGDIIFAGRDIGGLRPEQIACAGLTRTFQDVRVFDRFSLIENLMVGEEPFEGVGWGGALLRTGRFRAAREKAEARARDLIGIVGLTRLVDAPAAVLSDGQKKLLALAAALMAEPKLVILDEPVAGVNPTRINDIVDIIRRLNSAGTSFLIVEHNVEFICGLCSHVVVLERGRKLTEGPPDIVHSDPRVLDAYIGVEAGDTQLARHIEGSVA